MPSPDVLRTFAVDPRKPRQLTDGGPWVLWRRREAGERGEKEGLVVVSRTACANVGCDCVDVSIEARRVSDGLEKIEEMRSGSIQFSFRGGGHVEDPLDGSEKLLAAINFESGEVEPVEKGWNPELADWLRDEIDGEALDQLHDEWLKAKGFPKEPPPSSAPILFADPGVLVVWQEVFPSDRRDLYVLPEGSFEVLDAHCIVAECQCTECAIEVVEKGRFIGAMFYDYAKTRLVRTQSDERHREKLASVWTAYSRRHELRSHLARRARRLKELAAEIRRPRQELVPAVAGKRVGRNEPCPCGSGKKYKRCCLKRARAAPS